MSATKLNMDKEFSAELKNLRKEQTAVDREVEKSARDLVRARAAVQRKVNQRLREIDKLAKAARKEALREDGALLRAHSLTFKAQDKRGKAIADRISVLEGRLSS